MIYNIYYANSFEKKYTGILNFNMIDYFISCFNKQLIILVFSLKKKFFLVNLE